jgi:hypothetical protein
VHRQPGPPQCRPPSDIPSEQAILAQEARFTWWASGRRHRRGDRQRRRRWWRQRWRTWRQRRHWGWRRTYAISLMRCLPSAGRATSGAVATHLQGTLAAAKGTGKGQQGQRSLQLLPEGVGTLGIEYRDGTHELERAPRALCTPRGAVRCSYGHLSMHVTVHACGPPMVKAAHPPADVITWQRARSPPSSCLSSTAHTVRCSGKWPSMAKCVRASEACGL